MLTYIFLKISEMKKDTEIKREAGWSKMIINWHNCIGNWNTKLTIGCMDEASCEFWIFKIVGVNGKGIYCATCTSKKKDAKLRKGTFNSWDHHHIIFSFSCYRYFF